MAPLSTLSRGTYRRTKRIPMVFTIGFTSGHPTGTLIRYDNAHGGRHERHNPDGTVEAVDFPGIVALYERFLREVADWRDETKPK